MHDVFHVTRDGQPLTDDEGTHVKQWITQVGDAAHDAAKSLAQSTGAHSSASVGSKTEADENNSIRSGKSSSSARRLFGCACMVAWLCNCTVVTIAWAAMFRASFRAKF